MTTPCKAYSYIRFSTPEQQNGDSFRRQYERSKAYAEANSLILDEQLTYRDLGVSAFDRSNLRIGQLGAFLKAVDSRVVQAGSYLLVESLDRLSRAQITDALEIFLSIINRGITIVTFADGMEYSIEKVNKNFTDLIISIVIMSRAHEESATKSMRGKEVWISKRVNIDKKKLTAIGPGWLDLNSEKTEFFPIPHRVQLVQEIFEMTKNGLGSDAIGKRLNQQNVPTFGGRSGNLWHTSYIKKILGNRAVLGEFQPHVTRDGKRVPQGEPIPDYFPRIISDEDFALTAAAQKSRRTNGAGRKGAGLSNLFSGLVRCGYCQGPMVYVNKGHSGPRAKLLVCSHAKAGKECFYVPWEYSMFEKSVLTFCRGLDVEDFLRPNEYVKSEIAALSEKIVVLKAALAAVSGKLENIMEAIESGAKFDSFAARAMQLQAEKSHVDAQLKAAQQKYADHSTKEIDIKKVRATIDDLMKRMAELTGDDLYDIRASVSQKVKTLIGRIAAYPGGYIEKSKFVTALREHLLQSGRDPADIEAHITKNIQTEPNPKERFFTLVSHNASLRMIRPDMVDPEVLQVEMPEQAVDANLKLYAEGIQSMMTALKYKADNKIILKGN